jgi:uncharacterized protein YceK
MKNLILLFLIISLTGCATTYTSTEVKQFGKHMYGLGYNYGLKIGKCIGHIEEILRQSDELMKEK